MTALSGRNQYYQLYNPATLLSRATARKFGPRLRHTTAEGPGVADDAPDSADMKLAEFEFIWKVLGLACHCLPFCTGGTRRTSFTYLSNA